MLPRPSSGSALSLWASQLCSLPSDAHSIGPRSHCAHKPQPAESPRPTAVPRADVMPRGMLGTHIHSALLSPPGSPSVPQTPLHTQLRSFLFLVVLNYTFSFEIIVDSLAVVKMIAEILYPDPVSLSGDNLQLYSAISQPGY